MKPGVFVIEKKDGTPLFRASITVKDRHISLGSFPSEAKASAAYSQAKKILSSKKDLYSFVEDFREKKKSTLPFEKVVVLVNLRDSGVYIKTPIYLEKRSFLYLFSPDCIYKFDVDDLFYYSNHKIMKRGNHMFVADYGSQVNILTRYGIKSHAVPGRDYVFVNGDETDFRYGNIEIINRYHGVTRVVKNGLDEYVVKIHVNGDIIVGKYATEEEAALAYNKAAMILSDRGVDISYEINYLEGLSEQEYASKINRIRISEKIRKFKK